MGVGGSNVGVSTCVPESRRLTSDIDLGDLGVAGTCSGSVERYDRADCNECELEAESGMKVSFDVNGEGALIVL